MPEPTASPHDRAGGGARAAAQIARTILRHPAALALVAVMLAALCVLPGLGTPGLWEPQEMTVADQAASRVDGTYKPSTPMGECDEAPDPSGARTLTPRLAAAGLEEYKSDGGLRLPFALLGLLGVLATFGVAWRLGSPRAGLIASVILVSFPLWALQSRQLTGDLGSAVGATLVVYGLCALARLRGLDRGRPPAIVVITFDVVTASIAVAIGLWLAFASGGVLVGVIPPLAALAVAGGFGLSIIGAALAWSWRRVDRRRLRSPVRWPERGPSLVSLVAGVAVLAVTAWLVIQVFDLGKLTVGTRQIGGKSILVDDCWSRALGGVWRNDDDLRATYDSLFEQAGFGMFPWAVLVPIALASLATGLSNARRRWAGAVVLGWAVAGWAAAAVFQRKVGFAIFPGFPACAVGLGLWLDDIFTLRAAAATPGGERDAYRRMRWGLIGLIALLGVAVLAKDLQTFPDHLTSLLVGNDQIKYPTNAHLLGLPMKVWLLILGMTVALSLAAGCWLWAPRAAHGERPGFLELYGLDELGRIGIPAALVLTALFGMFWTHGWHRGLSQNLSSKHVFSVYRQLARSGDQLYIMGSMGNAPRYYAGGPWQPVAGRDQLFATLRRPERVFVMAPAAELCAIHRGRSEDTPYYVLDDSNARTMLLSNRVDGASDHNPLRTAIVSKPPPGLMPAPKVVWDNAIELVGMKLPKQVARGGKFEVTLVFKVIGQVNGTWKIFSHFDLGSSRIIGDHPPIRDRCATVYWQAGDYIVDTYTVEAGNASYPTGGYDVWIGFFTGSNPNWRNMTVTSAPDGIKDNNNRVKIGRVHVGRGGAGCLCHGGRGAGPGAIAVAGVVLLLILRRRRPAVAPGRPPGL